MKHWSDIVPGDYECSHCGAQPHKTCVSPSGSSASVHAARKAKAGHERYVQGLAERCAIGAEDMGLV